MTTLRTFWVRPYSWQPYQYLNVDRYKLEVDSCYEGHEWGVFAHDLIARGYVDTADGAMDAAERFAHDHMKARTTA